MNQYTNEYQNIPILKRQNAISLKQMGQLNGRGTKYTSIMSDKQYSNFPNNNGTNYNAVPLLTKT